MNPSNLDNLVSAVSKQYETAIGSGDAFFYESQVSVAKTDDVKNVVPWQIRNVPALLKKPKVVSDEQKTDNPQQNKADVFAPPYVPNLLVKELDDFTLLLNKFCVLPRHFLLVTKDFVKQELPPAPNMLAQAYQILKAYTPSESGNDMLSFFNCGQDSGASQPHCHFQFVELRPSAPTKPAVPIEVLLDQIERDGKEMEHVHVLPVPWRHFVVLLNPPEDATELENYLGTRFIQLLELMFSTARDNNDVQKGISNRPSFNVLLTRRSMHVIPRRTESFSLVEAEWGAYKNGGADAAPYSGTLSVNALDELEALCTDNSERILEVLSHTGMAG
ncbi:ATP adenylyltransferase [Malassezia equina]|uniref:ATP adenylyltransferase n=1 Tax=Malassezia equina TaxID=1381935 RepID=A0AAF0EET2_9BASI|nr:ATP adenylyltransferase [Malassezia equina]